jgi:two-component system, NarL family, response regulator LiaR
MLAALVVLLKVMEYHYFVRDLSIEFYLGLLAILFTCVGAWAGLKLTKPKTILVPVDPTTFAVNEEQLKALNISKRELDVLELMSAGFSNQEIAEKLFVSLNTIKTHTSNIFLKLDVKRRTQAVQKARELRLVK